MKPCKLMKLRIPPGAMNLCGRQIRLARVSHHPRVSQNQLVDCLGKLGVSIDRTALSRIENQQRGLSDMELKAIAICLHTTVAALMGEL